jgi:hypothetical protein
MTGFSKNLKSNIKPILKNRNWSDFYVEMFAFLKSCPYVCQHIMHILGQRRCLIIMKKSGEIRLCEALATGNIHGAKT